MSFDRYKEGYGYVGCVRGFTFLLEAKAGWIAGLSLVLAFIQVFFLCFFGDLRAKVC